MDSKDDVEEKKVNVILNTDQGALLKYIETILSDKAFVRINSVYPKIGDIVETMRKIVVYLKNRYDERVWIYFVRNVLNVLDHYILRNDTLAGTSKSFLKNAVRREYRDVVKGKLISELDVLNCFITMGVMRMSLDPSARSITFLALDPSDRSIKFLF